MAYKNLKVWNEQLVEIIQSFDGNLKQPCIVSRERSIYAFAL